MKTKEQKRAEAAERQAKYDALTVAEKLALSKSRPGTSLRERARIMANSALKN